MNLLYLLQVYLFIKIGYQLINPNDFADRMDRVVKQSLNINRNEKAVFPNIIYDEKDDPDIIGTQDVTMTMPPPESDASDKNTETPPTNNDNKAPEEPKVQDVKVEPIKTEELEAFKREDL